MLQPGCDLCGIRFFVSKNSKQYHMSNSVRHKVRLLLNRGELHQHVRKQAASVPDMKKVLDNFEHLPFIGHHQCRDCRLIVVLDHSSVELDQTASELSRHLLSTIHRSSASGGTKRKYTNYLPPETLPVALHQFGCYACEPFAIFDSYAQVCWHYQEVHKSNCVETPGLPVTRHSHELDFLVDNPDGISRTCTLCSVVVWYEDDWHLSGKRHKRAVANALELVGNNT